MSKYGKYVFYQVYNRVRVRGADRLGDLIDYRAHNQIWEQIENPIWGVVETLVRNQITFYLWRIR